MLSGAMRLILLAVLLLPTGVAGQERRSNERQTLIPYVGQEVLVVDTTLGERQFVNDDASLTYRVTLVAVMDDHLVVKRDVEGDKRSFVYPLAVIRRVLTAAEGKPLPPPQASLKLDGRGLDGAAVVECQDHLVTARAVSG